MASTDDGPHERRRALSLADLIDRRSGEIVEAWIRLQSEGAGPRGPVDVAASLRGSSTAIVEQIGTALRAAGRIYDPVGPEFEPLRALVAEASRRGARQGATPAETAHGVLALREAFNVVAQSEHEDIASFGDAVIASARLVDALALLTFETYMQSREQVIRAQGAQLVELSTPVVQLWDGILGVPLVGTLDSARAQVVMEALLQAIVDDHAQVAILDITGVPTFDTLVAQNLLKTVTATRLMGADCIISGIRPQTAQTIVQLGIDLTEITTRATLADALKTAIRRVDPGRRPASRRSRPDAWRACTSSRSATSCSPRSATSSTTRRP